MDLNALYAERRNENNNAGMNVNFTEDTINEDQSSFDEMMRDVNKIPILIRESDGHNTKIDRDAMHIADTLVSTQHVGDNGYKEYLTDSLDHIDYTIDADKNRYKGDMKLFDMRRALLDAFPPPAKMMVQTRSTNVSAINMAKLLYGLNVKRWYLPLLLFDTSLNGVDPYSQNLTQDQQNAIMIECKQNLFYFAREAVRVPAAGVSTGVSCFFHLGSFTSLFLTFNSISYYLEQPRQTYKTGTDAVINAWFFNFATNNATVGIFGYTEKKAKDNLHTVVEVLDMLPDYLCTHKYKVIRDSAGNVESYEAVREFGKSPSVIRNEIQNNRIEGKTTGKTQETARNAGRGSSYIKINFDELGWAKYNYLSYGAAQPAYDEVARVAEENGLPHCISMTSTPPDATTKEGEWLFKLLFEEAVPFTIKLFEMNPKEIKQYLRLHGKKDIVFASFMYNELGFSEEWLISRFRKAPNIETFCIEVLLQWRRELSKSPFNHRDLERIETNCKNTVFHEFMLNDKYAFKIYEGYEKAKYKKIIMGSDVGGGGGGMSDYSTIVGTDPDTTEVLFTFRANVFDTTIFANIIADAHRQLAPNGILVIERNNMGSSVIALLKYMDDIEPFLYYAGMSDKQIAINMNTDKQLNGRNQKYGFVTGAVSRDVMYKEILHMMVNRYKRMFKSSDICRELMSICRTESGRYDHLPGYHDDLLISYLFTLHVLYKDTELYDKFMISQPHVLDDMSVMDGDKAFDIVPKKDPNEGIVVDKFLDAINKKRNDPSLPRTMDEDLFIAEMRRRGIGEEVSNGNGDKEIVIRDSIRDRADGGRRINSLLPDNLPKFGF